MTLSFSLLDLNKDTYTAQDMKAHTGGVTHLHQMSNRLTNNKFVPTYIFTYIPAYGCMDIGTYIHTHTHAYIHMYTHTHTHIFTYIPAYGCILYVYYICSVLSSLLTCSISNCKSLAETGLME